MRVRGRALTRARAAPGALQHGHGEDSGQRDAGVRLRGGGVTGSQP